MANWIVELDGKKYTLEGGDTAPSEEEARAAIGEFSKPVPDTSLKTALNTVNTVGNSALQGFGDKLGAGMDATAQYALDKLGGSNLVPQKPTGESASWRDRYNRIRQLDELEQTKFQEEHPALSIGADITGAVVSPINKLLPIGGGTALARVGKAVASGGALGALRGAGMSKTNENPLEESLEGAGLGALSGGLLGGGIEAIKAGIKPILGMTTGAGKGAVERAFESGKRGSTNFIKSMRGEIPETEIVDETKKAVQNMYNKAAEQLSAGKESIGKTKIDLKPILNSIKSTEKSFEIEGVKSSLINSEEKKVLDRAKELIDLFKKNPQAQNVKGIDALKQTIGKIPVGNDVSAMRLRTQLYNDVKNTINESAPEYSAIMKPYADTMEKLNQISGELGVKTGRGGNIYSTLGKLQSSIRNDAGTRYGARQNLIKMLGDESSEKILDSAAGQAMSEIVPRGLASKTGATLTGVGALSTPIGAAGALSLPLFSPRIVGEAAYGLGKASSKLPKDSLMKAIGAILAGQEQ